MRVAVMALCLTCAAPVLAAEAWFLPYAPDEHTIALFHFDGEGEEHPNAADADIHATLVKGATRGQGMFDGGVLLRGAKECIRFGDSERLSFGNAQPFTIEGWLRPDSAEGALLSVGTRFYLQASFSRGTASFGYRAASFPIRWFAMSGVPWQRREWQHFALTHDAERVARIYLNGVEVASTSHADEGDYEGNLGGVFGAHDGWTNFLVGAMDEMRVSDTVRTFQPLLTQSAYLPGEQVQLELGAVVLPVQVTTIQVSARNAAGDEVFARDVPLADAGRPLFDAAQLGDGVGQLTVAFLDADGQVMSSVLHPVSFAGALSADLDARSQACTRIMSEAVEGNANVVLYPEFKTARSYLAGIGELVAARKFDAATRRTEALERLTATLKSREAQYRARIRDYVRKAERDDRIRVTMSWGADEAAKDAFPWAERLGANELVTPSRSVTPEGLKTWREAGYHTAMLSGLPIHAAEKDNPDHLQFGYWTNDPVTAEGDTVALKLVSPTWGNEAISTHFDPKQYWLVSDVTADQPVGPERWEYDAQTRTLTITGAEPGHSYRVYFMMQTGHIGDPLYEPFAEHGLAKLDELIAPLEGELETYWYDDLGYAYPGPTPQGVWDWESYTLAARPEHQQAFTAATGIAFDPRWLVMPPKTLDVPPQPEYFAWMSWLQSAVKEWMARATEVVHNRGIRTWLYWGDCHVGIEPFLGSLTAGNVDEVDKPSGDPVTARALVDFPGDIYRRMRVDWLHGHVVSRPDAARRLRDKWDAAKRGLLMSPPQGIYWMPFPNAAALSEDAVREDLAEELARIDDEFRLIAGHLSGHRAYEGDLNLYVVHSWGKQYSWRPWGDRLLTNLTDLPVRVRFLSFREVIADGVPEDADVLFLYGMPNTAWSGGYVWEDEALPAAITDFVNAGGGIVGVQAPSYTDLPEPRWALADLFGLTGEGTAGYEPGAIAPETFSGEAMQAAAQEEGASLVPVAKPPAWLAELDGRHIPAMQSTVKVSALAEDVTVTCALEADDGEWVPGATFRQAGQGRAVYVCGYSGDYAFYRLLRAAIYWAGKRQDRLSVSGGDNLFAYAYADLSIIAVLSTDQEPAEVILRCAPNVLGLPAEAACTVSDLVTGEDVAARADLSEGIAVTTVPHCARLLRVRAVQ